MTARIASCIYISASISLALEVAPGGVVIVGLLYTWARYRAQMICLDLRNISAEIPPERVLLTVDLVLGLFHVE